MVRGIKNSFSQSSTVGVHFAQFLAQAALSFSLLAPLALARFFIAPAIAQFPEHAVLLQLALQFLDSIVDVVVANLDFHKFLSLLFRVFCTRRSCSPACRKSGCCWSRSQRTGSRAW